MKHRIRDLGPSQPLRITFLTAHFTPEPTGNAPYTTGLAEGLAEMGHEVHVLTAHPFYPGWRIQPGYGGWSRNEELAGAHIHRMAHYIPTKPTGLRRLLSELSLGLRFLTASWHRPDVLLLASPALFSCAPAVLRARITGIPTAAWVQDLYSLGVVETGQGGRGLASIVEAIESTTLRSVDGVAVIHERFRTYVVKQLGIRPNHTEVIRNWSHFEASDELDPGAIRRRLGWAETETVVLHAGNMGVKQGLENVVAAARIADDMGVPLRFVLLGDGTQRRRIENLAQDIRSIEFINPLPDRNFQQALASADLLLVNERVGLREMSVPSKLTSYFTTSLPIIAATDPSSVTADEIAASGGGIVIPPDDPAALVHAALALRADPAKARSLGAAGRRYRDEVLSADSALTHFTKWLTGLALKPPRKRTGTAKRVPMSAKR